MIIQHGQASEGIFTAGRCFLFGLPTAALATSLHAQQRQLTDVAIQGYAGELVDVFHAPQ